MVKDSLQYRYEEKHSHIKYLLFKRCELELNEGHYENASLVMNNFFFLYPEEENANDRFIDSIFLRTRNLFSKGELNKAENLTKTLAEVSKLNAKENIFHRVSKAREEKLFHEAIFFLLHLFFLDAEDQRTQRTFSETFRDIFKERSSKKIEFNSFYLTIRDTLIFLMYFNIDDIFFCKLAGSGDVTPSYAVTGRDLESGNTENFYKAIGVHFPDKSVMFVVPTDEGSLYVPSLFADTEDKSIIRYEKQLRLRLEDGAEIKGISLKGTILFDINDYIPEEKLSLEEREILKAVGVGFLGF